jgi:hypothetical protein
MGTDFGNDNAKSITKSEIVGRLCQTPWRFAEWSRGDASDMDGQRARASERGEGVKRPTVIQPSGVLTSVPGGGLNSKVEAGIGARV